MKVFAECRGNKSLACPGHGSLSTINSGILPYCVMSAIAGEHTYVIQSEPMAPGVWAVSSSACTCVVRVGLFGHLQALSGAISYPLSYICASCSRPKFYDCDFSLHEYSL